MSKIIILSPKSPISQEVVEKLENLVECSPANSIRSSLMEVYQQYIISNHEALPVNFEEIATDFYMLIDFFTQIEEEHLN